MKTTFKKTAAVFAMAAFTVLLSSFLAPKGGDGFEIYAGKQLLHQQYPASRGEVKIIVLQPSHGKEQLYVRFSHCGRPGTERKLTIKNGAQQVLHTWTFGNDDNAAIAAGGNGFIGCSIREIMNLQKGGNTGLRLYYSSKQLVREQLLAILQAPAQTTP